MENMKKTVIITLALCLGAGQHSPVSAAVYDFTNRDANDANLLEKEYHAAGGKTISVKNESSNNIYLRIGYEACEFTGFKLKPGQTGRVYKSPFCVPFNVSGHFLAEDGKVIGDIQNPIFKKRMDEIGNLQWNVDNDGLRYLGAWKDGEWLEGPALAEGGFMGAFIPGNVPKKVTVSNHTERRVYIRIGYEACQFDGFYLAKGESKAITKAAGCVPYVVSGYIYLDGVTPTDLVRYEGKIYKSTPSWSIQMNNQGSATVHYQK